MSNLPQCPHDNRERRVRFIAKPIGTYSIAGSQPKLVGAAVEVCEECWQKMQANVAKGIW